MARSRITPAIVGLALGAVLATGVARAAAPPAPLQPVLRQLVREGAPGALVVVRTPAGLRRVATGLGRRQPRVALRPTDRFRVGSVTKTFVATVALELVGEGKLHLDDPVEKWLPRLVPNGRAITIRELLNHYERPLRVHERSGLREGGDCASRAEVACAPSGGDRRLAPTLVPSGDELVVLEHELRRPRARGAGGHRYHARAARLRDRILRPLGLTKTSFPADTGIAGEYAHGYIGFATLPSIPAGKLLDVEHGP